MERDLHDLLTEAAPTTIPPADLADVRRRARRRRLTRTTTSLATFVVLAAVALPLARGLVTQPDVEFADPPGTEGRGVRSDPTVVHEFRAGDVDKELVVYPSRHGLCVETRNKQRPHNMGGGCGFDVPPQVLSMSVGTQGGVTIVSGPVVKEADRVVVRTMEGPAIDAGPFGQGLGFGVNFFLAVVPSDKTPDHVVAFDADGHVLGKDALDTTPPGPMTIFKEISNGTAVVYVPEDWPVSEPEHCPGEDVPSLRLGPGLDDECRQTVGSKPGVLMYRVSYGVDVSDIVEDGRALPFAGQQMLIHRRNDGRVAYFFPHLDLLLVIDSSAEAHEVVRSVQRETSLPEGARDTAECYAAADAARPAVTIELDAGAHPEYVCAWQWRDGDVKEFTTTVPPLVMCQSSSLEGPYQVVPGQGDAPCVQHGLDRIEFAENAGDFDDPSAVVPPQGEQ